MKKLQIDIWSDIACPWCYVGKRRLEAALARFPHRSEVEVTWHAFELDPTAPRVRDESHAQLLSRKYGRTLAQAGEMLTQMTATAAADGLDFHFEKSRPGNTFDAHRLVQHAAERGRGDAMQERLMKAYFTEGQAVGEVETLVALGAEVGLPAEEVRAMLASGQHADEVRADEREAGESGIRGVPFFVFERRYAVSGAQPAEALLEVLDKTWAERGPSVVAATAAGEVCGVDGC